MDESMSESVERTSSGGFLFWPMSLMAMAAFAPCVILPEWRDYEAVYSAQQTREQDLAAFEQAVHNEQRKLEALQSDPATIARLAQRELSFRRTGERSVAVGEPVSAGAIDFGASAFTDRMPGENERGLIESPPLPANVSAWIARLPSLDYDALFCDEQMRLVIMTMSLSLIVLAFVLFGRRTRMNESASASPGKTAPLGPRL